MLLLKKLIFDFYTKAFKDKYMEDRSALTHAQIMNLKKRLILTKNMQLVGVASLLLCVVTMFFIYVGLQTVSVYSFGIALLLLIISLSLSVMEIRSRYRSSRRTSAIGPCARAQLRARQG